MLVSYCVVNTNGREFLLRCLEAIERTTPPGLEHEILVLDNASDDGSADAVRALGGDIRLFALDRREAVPSIEAHLAGLDDGPARDVAQRRMLRTAALAECGSSHQADLTCFSATFATSPRSSQPAEPNSSQPPPGI